MTIKLPDAASVAVNPTQAEMRGWVEQYMPRITVTEFGNINYQAQVTARLAGSTFFVSEDETFKPTISRAEYEKWAAKQDAYIADKDNFRIRRVDAVTGVITTIAEGKGVAVDGAGNLYIVDSGKHHIRHMEAGTGLITTVAGTGGTSGGGHRARGERDGATGDAAGGHANHASSAVNPGRPRAESREPYSHRRGHPDESHLVARMPPRRRSGTTLLAGEALLRTPRGRRDATDRDRPPWHLGRDLFRGLGRSDARLRVLFAPRPERVQRGDIRVGRKLERPKRRRRQR